MNPASQHTNKTFVRHALDRTAPDRALRPAARPPHPVWLSCTPRWPSVRSLRHRWRATRRVAGDSPVKRNTWCHGRSACRRKGPQEHSQRGLLLVKPPPRSTRIHSAAPGQARLIIWRHDCQWTRSSEALARSWSVGRVFPWPCTEGTTFRHSLRRPRTDGNRRLRL